MYENISKLSNAMLVEKLVVLSTKEREATAEVLLHLIELDKRKLYREQGYSSLYAYCIHGLRYSSSAAKRRLVAVRCIAEYPEVYDMFLKNDVSLTTISIFASVLTRENKQQILSQVAGRSPTEVEWIVARLNPTRPSLDRIVPMVVQQVVEDLAVAAQSVGKNLEFPLGPAGPAVNSRECKALPSQECYRIEFSASKHFKEKLDTVKSLASRPGATLEQVLELVMDDYINRHSPEKREERRKTRQEKRANQQGRSSTLHKRTVSDTGLNIPRATRDKVFVRDGLRCTFVSDDGVQCRATTGLHLDHVQPPGLGGSHTVENLRVLCGAHNRLAAERAYGKGFMEQFY